MQRIFNLLITRWVIPSSSTKSVVQPLAPAPAKFVVNEVPSFRVVVKFNPFTVCDWIVLLFTSVLLYVSSLV